MKPVPEFFLFDMYCYIVVVSGEKLWIDVSSVIQKDSPDTSDFIYISINYSTVVLLNSHLALIKLWYASIVQHISNIYQWTMEYYC